MKQIKTLVIVAVMLIGSQAIQAQAKTAHVEVNEIISKMPAMLDAQKQLEKLSGTYDAEYKTMVDEYQNKLKNTKKKLQLKLKHLTKLVQKKCKICKKNC